MWKSDGKYLYQPPEDPSNNRLRGIASAGCDLDGTIYHTVKMDSIPDVFAAVPVTVDDSCHIYKARIVAGSVGFRVTSSGDILDSRELRGFIARTNREQIHTSIYGASN